MLIRISGGSGGIGKYLRDGIKQGRGYTRDELDERVILYGDIDLTESVINTVPGEGEKYLHITMSFKEDLIQLGLLQSVTEEFRRFATHAYREDEFNFYAEAHLPRIKSYINKRTGELVERKPHIHMVIPEHNLLTGKRLNPFGRVEHQIKFLEAFQEFINAKYGLASPKDNRRVRLILAGESEIISRYKGDIFKGAGSDVKQKIFTAILNGDISNYESFRTLASSFGAIRTRNKGRDAEYLNVLPDGSNKGINLKDYVFSREFIGLPVQERQRALIEQAKLAYTDIGREKQTSKQIANTLREWYEVRALELKYINSGNRTLYKKFRAANQDERKRILRGRADEFYNRYDLQCDSNDYQAVEYGGYVDHESYGIDYSNMERADTAVDQMLFSYVASKEIRYQSGSADFTKIKIELDAHRLLAALSKSHGVIVSKYSVSKGSDGGDRIKCGARNLNVSDFLTKECHLPWNEAAAILKSEYTTQIKKHAFEARADISKSLWAKFRETWPAHVAQKKLRWEEQRAQERQRREEIRADYMRERAVIRGSRSLTATADRRAALSITAMKRVAADIALRKLIEEEREQLRAFYRRSLHERYVDFLHARAGIDEVALAELRRVSGDRTEVFDDIIEGDVEMQPTPVAVVMPLPFRVERSGAITYFADMGQSHALLIDTGRRVQVPYPDREAVEAGLHLALQKFGPTLSVTGSVEFRALVIQVAADLRLQVEFNDPGMSADLQLLRQEQQRAFERGAVWLEEQKPSEAAAQRRGEGVWQESEESEESEESALPCSEPEQPQPQNQSFELDNRPPRNKGLSL